MKLTDWNCRDPLPRWTSYVIAMQYMTCMQCIQGPRSSRMRSGFTHKLWRSASYVERSTVTPCSEKLVTNAQRIATHPRPRSQIPWYFPWGRVDLQEEGTFHSPGLGCTTTSQTDPPAKVAPVGCVATMALKIETVTIPEGELHGSVPDRPSAKVAPVLGANLRPWHL